MDKFRYKIYYLYKRIFILCVLLWLSNSVLFAFNVNKRHFRDVPTRDFDIILEYKNDKYSVADILSNGYASLLNIEKLKSDNKEISLSFAISNLMDINSDESFSISKDKVHITSCELSTIGFFRENFAELSYLFHLKLV